MTFDAVSMHVDDGARMSAVLAGVIVTPERVLDTVAAWWA